MCHLTLWPGQLTKQLSPREAGLCDRIGNHRNTRERMIISSWIAVAVIYDCLGIETVRGAKENEITAAEDMEPTFNYPFLNDPKTVTYVGESRTLMILRGPPGCGKSDLAAAILEQYPGKVAICNAEKDIPQDEKPPFSKQTLEKAHSDCQDCVRNSCKGEFPIVIVDNTNSSLFAVKNYSSIGHEFDYVDILVAPQTSWILDAQELVKRSSRGYSLEEIQKKVEKFQKALYPLFYGWFLNRTDSENMRSVGKKFYESCLSSSVFKDEFTKHLLPDPSGKTPDPEHYFSAENYPVGPVMLHGTAFYSNYGNVSQSETYAARDAVKSGNGKAFTITVIGLLITPRSMGLRLKLNNEELPLWLADDKVVKDEEIVDASGASVASMPSDDQCIITDLSPTCGTGSRAHFSLGSGPGVEAVQTGLDMVEIVQMEQEVVRGHRQYTAMITLDGGMAVGYGDGNWMVYFDKSCSVESLFAGYF